MYDPLKDISRRHAEEAIKECFEGYAGEFEYPSEPVIPLNFGLEHQCDPGEPLSITSRTFEVAHRFAAGKGRTLEDAVDEFVQSARFEWPSLKNRFTIAWRRKPQISFDQDFQAMAPVFKITARYSLILDWEPLEKERPA